MSEHHESRVFILGFAGTEIYYSVSERSIQSGISGSFHSDELTTAEDAIDEGAADRE